MKRKRLILLNPGPVNVTSRVRRALLGPDICHREPEFRRMLSRVRAKLLGAFGISRTHRAALFTGSGTCALEAMLSSFPDARKKTLVLSNGVYGERMRKMLELRGLPFAVLAAPYGRFPSVPEIERALAADRSIASIAMVHHETSTGMLNPLAEVTKIARKRKKFMIVDAVSSIGAEPIVFRDIDLCAGVSGKCLHGFPGVSFVLVSLRAAEALKHREKRSLYLDLSSALEADTAFTPAVQVLYAFEAALDELKREGLSKRIRSYRDKSARIERGMEKLGVRFVVEKELRSHVLTALWVPPNISYDALHDRLKKEGFVIYSGQSTMKDRIFRVSNLGDVSIADLDRLVKRLGAILAG